MDQDRAIDRNIAIVEFHDVPVFVAVMPSEVVCARRDPTVFPFFLGRWSGGLEEISPQFRTGDQELSERKVTAFAQTLVVDVIHGCQEKFSEQ